MTRGFLEQFWERYLTECLDSHWTLKRCYMHNLFKGIFERGRNTKEQILAYGWMVSTSLLQGVLYCNVSYCKTPKSESSEDLEPLRSILSLFHTKEVERQQTFIFSHSSLELISHWQEFLLNLLCHWLGHSSFLCPTWTWSKLYWGQGDTFSQNTIFHLSLPEPQSHPLSSRGPTLVALPVWKPSHVAAEHGKPEFSMMLNQTRMNFSCSWCCFGSPVMQSGMKVCHFSVQ